MPRRSSASLAVIGPGGVETVRRPDAPFDLNDEEQRVWKDVVNSMAADWFPRETHGLLTEYCRLIVCGRRLSELRHAMEEDKENFDLGQYRQLIRDQAGLAKSVAILARNMRLSQGSTSRQAYVKKRPMMISRKPWDRNDPQDDDEEE